MCLSFFKKTIKTAFLVTQSLIADYRQKSVKLMPYVYKEEDSKHLRIKGFVLREKISNPEFWIIAVKYIVEDFECHDELRLRDGSCVFFKKEVWDELNKYGYKVRIWKM